MNGPKNKMCITTLESLMSTLEFLSQTAPM